MSTLNETAELFRGTADEMTDAEKQLETDIAHAAMRFHTTKDVQARARWWTELKRLHAQRTRATIERMERKKGLI